MEKQAKGPTGMGREPYHVQLWQAMKEVNRVADRAESLLQRITNSPSQIEEDIKEQNPPSLQYVLQNGAASLMASCDRICKTLDAIIQELF